MYGQANWLETPPGRFPAIPTIASCNGGPVCLGIFVSAHDVLAAADCIDEIGDHPIVTWNPYGPVLGSLPGFKQVNLFGIHACWMRMVDTVGGLSN